MTGTVPARSAGFYDSKRLEAKQQQQATVNKQTFL